MAVGGVGEEEVAGDVGAFVYAFVCLVGVAEGSEVGWARVYTKVSRIIPEMVRWA